MLDESVNEVKSRGRADYTVIKLRIAQIFACVQVYILAFRLISLTHLSFSVTIEAVDAASAFSFFFESLKFAFHRQNFDSNHAEDNTSENSSELNCGVELLLV